MAEQTDNDFKNHFSGGLKQDTDLAYRKPDSYSDSINGRIVFNANGKWSWVNEKGNKLLFSLTTGYTPIGGVEFADKVVILSTNNINSEIGLLMLNGDGTLKSYQRIFNDLFDPNGDLLDFSTNTKIKKIIAHKEGAFIERVYWTDATLTPGRFNVLLGLASISPEFINGDYQPLTSTGKYPWFYSVHSMALQPNHAMGKVKFVQEIDGALKTGVIRLSYRLISRDGYRTPWTPLGTRYFITINPAEPVLDTGPSQFDRFMYASNIQTSKGYRFNIEGIDTRYYQLQVAYAYSIAQDATVEAGIFYQENIDPTQSTAVVDFQNMTGTPVDLSEFNQIIIPIKTCETLEEKDQRLWPGGITTYGPYVIDTTTISVGLSIKPMVVDELTDARINPLTNTTPKTTTVSLNAYTDKIGTNVLDTYAINDDYANYRGVQYDHLLASYWRGETYPFAIVIFDLKGNPFYAQHIQDFTFPQQYEDGDFNALMTTPGTISLMGADFSNINIPKSILYDENGKLLISGFSIMRTERLKKILAQGVVINTVVVPKSGGTDSLLTIPLPMPSNNFDREEPFGGVPNSSSYDATFQSSDSHVFGNRPYTYMFHSPELSFGVNIWDGIQQTSVNEETDLLQLVEAYTSKYENNDFDYNKVIDLDDSVFFQFYTKQYQLVYDENLLNNIYPKGTTSRIRLEGTPTLGGGPYTPYDPDQPSLKFQNTGEFKLGSFGAVNASGAVNSWLIKGKDFKDLSVGNNFNSTPCYFVANYLVPQQEYYGISTSSDAPVNQESLANRQYISTGHFQPITNEILATVPQVTVKGQLCYQFNNVEVYGGDCYPNLFDFTRQYPSYSGDCTNDNDYSVSMIIPLETTLNIALRYGRSFARNGVRSQFEACLRSNATNPSPLFDDGIMVQQPESFNINDVLLFKEDVQFYLPLQPSVNPFAVDFPNRWMYSIVKFDLEIYDSYTQFLANNFGDTLGVYGDIIGSFFLFDAIYCLQERALSRLRINERSMISQQNGQLVQTGPGLTYDKPLYISTVHGCRHPFSIIGNDKGYYWIDEVNKDLCRFAQDGLVVVSDEGEMHDFFYDIIQHFDEEFIDGNTYKHIHGVYDNINDEVIYTFLLNDGNGLVINKTLTYNEKAKAFSSFSDFLPFIYISGRGSIISANPSAINKQYIHLKGDYGTFYDAVQDSILEFVINPFEDVDKQFNNIFCNITESVIASLYKIEMITDKAFQTLAVTGDNKSIYRNGNFLTPIMQRNQEKRVEGKYCKLRFYFSNTPNQMVKFTSNITRVKPIPKVH